MKDIDFKNKISFEQNNYSLEKFSPITRCLFYYWLISYFIKFQINNLIFTENLFFYYREIHRDQILLHRKSNLTPRTSYYRIQRGWTVKSVLFHLNQCNLILSRFILETLIQKINQENSTRKGSLEWIHKKLTCTLLEWGDAYKSYQSFNIPFAKSTNILSKIQSRYK